MREVAIEERLAEALAWASLGHGLGLTGIPRRVSHLTGIEDDKASRKRPRIVGEENLTTQFSYEPGPARLAVAS
jgi:hypothetical protein